MTAIYMLDTDISSYVIKENDKKLTQKFIKHQNDDICISSVTYAELLYGAMNKNSPVLTSRIKLFFSLVRVVDFGKDAGEEYARIRHSLKTKGTPIGNMDMIIAACAKAAGAVLITNNQKHFSQVSGLVLEKWI